MRQSFERVRQGASAAFMKVVDAFVPQMNVVVPPLPAVQDNGQSSNGCPLFEWTMPDTSNGGGMPMPYLLKSPLSGSYSRASDVREEPSEIVVAESPLDRGMTHRKALHVLRMAYGGQAKDRLVDPLADENARKAFKYLADKLLPQFQGQRGRYDNDFLRSRAGRFLAAADHTVRPQRRYALRGSTARKRRAREANDSWPQNDGFDHSDWENFDPWRKEQLIDVVTWAISHLQDVYSSGELGRFCIDDGDSLTEVEEAANELYAFCLESSARLSDDDDAFARVEPCIEELEAVLLGAEVTGAQEEQPPAPLEEIQERILDFASFLEDTFFDELTLAFEIIRSGKDFPRLMTLPEAYRVLRNTQHRILQALSDIDALPSPISITHSGTLLDRVEDSDALGKVINGILGSIHEVLSGNRSQNLVVYPDLEAEHLEFIRTVGMNDADALVGRLAAAQRNAYLLTFRLRRGEVDGSEALDALRGVQAGCWHLERAIEEVRELLRSGG